MAVMPTRTSIGMKPSTQYAKVQLTPSGTTRMLTRNSLVLALHSCSGHVLGNEYHTLFG
ncbi:hypothetical protein PR003_g22104 [Phytophthora rubi]|nr:hypothetical protein PF008_g30047 [Phytophthora fragariae]KAE9303065.1 hypothetical protein PR003_g22104 [Phytophthora rubi]